MQEEIQITQIECFNNDGFVNFLSTHLPQQHSKNSIEFILEYCKEWESIKPIRLSHKTKELGYSTHTHVSGLPTGVYQTIFSYNKITKKNEDALYQQLDEIYDTLAHDGEFLLGIHPSSNADCEKIHEILDSCFWSVERQPTASPIWVCTK